MATFRFEQLVPEHLEPDELLHELERRGVTGVEGVAEQRRALRGLLRSEQEEHVLENPTSSDVDEFQRCADKVSKLMKVMRVSGSDPYAIRVMYSRWAAVERRLRNLGEKNPGLIGDCHAVYRTIADVYNGYYRTDDDQGGDAELSEQLNSLNISQPRESCVANRMDMAYRTPTSVFSSRDSSPAHDNRANELQEVFHDRPRGAESERRESVTIETLRSCPELSRDVEMSDRLCRSATHTGRNHDGALDHGPFMSSDDETNGQRRQLSVPSLPVDTRSVREELNRRLSVRGQPRVVAFDEGRVTSESQSQPPRNERVPERASERFSSAPTGIMRPTRVNQPVVIDDEDDIEDDQEYQEMCASLMNTVQATLRDFFRSRSPRPRTPARALHTPSSERSRSQPGRHDVPPETPRQSASQTRTSGVPISKWKIDKFDGKEGELARFLTRVNQYALAEGASKSDLFRNRIHLFTGHAADFVALSTHIHSWDALVEEITKFSMGSTSDCDLLRKIQERKQGVKESCAVYVTQMEMLFRNLRQPLSEEDRCDIIIRGLRPAIRCTLAGNSQLRTLHDLRLAAQRVEKLTVTQREVLEVGETASLNIEGRRRMVSPRQNGNGSRENKPRANMKDFCFNCGEKTHHRKECTKEKQILCYECGKVGVYASQCCWKTGNGQGRV